MIKSRKILTMLLAVVMTLGLAACANNNEEEGRYPTPDDFEPMYYTSEEELPENAYYITHPAVDYVEDKKTGEVTEVKYTKYYPLLQSEKTYSEKRTEYAGYDFNRVTWVNYNTDEGLIPTMYAGDKLIYKSSTYIPTKYALEKFFDNGYTLGVCGLKQDLSTNYAYVSGGTDKGGSGFVLSTSDAAGFESLEAESIYFVYVDDTYVTPLNVSLSGTITGLNLMQQYECDIRTGTEKIAATLTCNARYFSSAETYMFGAFTFITPIIAELNIPEYVSTGYYEINDAGFFRYVADKPEITDWHKVTADMCNKTIYTYNEEGRVNGTTIGLVFDENGFLTNPGLLDKVDFSNNIEEEQQTYEEWLDVLLNGINLDKKTVLSSEGGYYYDTYKIDKILSEEISGATHIYKFEATSDKETIAFYYKVGVASEQPKAGKTYQIVFKDPSTGNINAYVVSNLFEVSGSNEEEVPDDKPETENDSTEE